MDEGLLSGSGGVLDPATPQEGLGLLTDIPAPSPIKQGLGAGVAGLKSGLYGFGALAAHGVAAAANAVGATPVANLATGLEQSAVANQTEQAQLASPESAPTWDKASLADPSTIAHAAEYSLASFAPTLLTMLAGGGIAGAGAKALGLASEAAPGVLAAAKNIGALASLVPGSVGEEYARAKGANASNPELSAITGGIGSVLPYAIPLGALDKFGAKVGGGMLQGAVKGAGVGAAAMEAQGLASTAIQRAAAGQDVTGPEATAEYLSGAANNLFLGGALGAAAGAHHGLAPEPVVRPGLVTEGRVPEKGTTVPELGTTVPEPATPEIPRTPEAIHEQLVAAHTEATQKVATIEPLLAEAQAAHDALVAKRDALTAESKLDAGERRTKEAILVEKKDVQAQLKEAKAKIEEVGGQLNDARKSVTELAPQVEEAKKNLPTEPPSSKTPGLEPVPKEEPPVEKPAEAPTVITPEMHSDLKARGFEPGDIARMEPTAAAETIRTMPTVEDAVAAARVSAGGEPLPEQKLGTSEQVPKEGNASVDAGLVKNPTETLPTPAEPLTDLQQLHEHIAATIAATGNLKDETKVARADKVESVIAMVTEVAKKADPADMEAIVKSRVDKQLKNILPDHVRSDITEHILKVARGDTKFSKGSIDELSKRSAKDLRGLEKQLGDAFVNGKMSFAEYSDQSKPVIQARVSAELRENRLGPAKGIADVFPGFKQIPVGTKILATHGSKYETPTMGTVVGSRSMKSSLDGMVTLHPIVDFGDGKPRTITTGGVHEVYAPRLAQDSRGALTQETFDALPEQAKFAAVDAYNAVLRDKGTALRDHLTQLIGDRPELKVTTFQAEPGGPIGSYTRTGPLKAAISMATNAKEILSVADHEGYHYAEDWLLTSAEKRIVANAMKDGKPLFEQLKERLQKYDRENQTNLLDEVMAVPAEARAYGFEFWRRGEFKAEGPLARAWEKLKQFFEKVANKVKGLGFQSTEDIFAALDHGQMAERDALAKEGKPEVPAEAKGTLPDPELEQMFSRAALEQKTREAAGELELTQMFRSGMEMVDNAKLHKNDALIRSMLGPAANEVKGSIARWWMDNISRPVYISAFSKGFDNVQKVLARHTEYRNVLSEQLLREKIPQWYHASFKDQDAAFKVLLETDSYSKVGLEAGTESHNAALRSLTPEQRVLRDSARNMINGFLDAELATDTKDYKEYLLSPGTYDKWLKDRTAQVQEMKDKGYVPLRRYGDHTVRIFKDGGIGKDGKPQQVEVRFEGFQHQAEAEIAAALYQKEVDRIGGGYKVEIGIRHTTTRESTPSIHQYLDTARRNGVEISQMERERLVMALTASDSMLRNRLMMRSGMPGYSADGMRVLNEFGMNLSGKIAYSAFGRAIDAAAEGRKVDADVVNRQPVIKIDYPQIDEATGKQEPPDAYKARNMWEIDGPKSGYYRDRADLLTNTALVPSRGGDLSRNLRGLALPYFIGGSISGAAVNAMSIPMMLVPQLSIHTNYLNGLMHSMSAWKDTWQHQAILRDVERLRNATKDPKNFIPSIDNVPGLRDALIAAADKLQDTELHQIMSISQGQFFSQSRSVQKAMDIYMAPFRIAEQTNRITSFIAGYKVAMADDFKKADGTVGALKGQELFNFARDMVDSTQNDYGVANRPGAVNNPVFALMFMFKSFPLFMIESAHLMYKANPKAAVNMLLGLTALTGVQGLPFADTILDLVDTISQHLFNSPFNARRAMRNLVKSASEAVAGYDASNLVMRGMLNEFIDVSGSSRLGTGDFVPGTRVGTADAQEGKILAQVAGAPYSMVKDVASNMGKFVGGVFTGDWKQTADALRAGGPIAIRNAIKGAEQLASGEATDSKGRKVADVSTLNAMLQLTGLSSGAVAKMYDQESIIVQTKAFYTQVSQDLQTQLVNAYRTNDQDKIREVIDLRNKWNAENPGMRIMPSPAATARAIVLANVPLPVREKMMLGRRMGAEFTDVLNQ